MKQVILTFFVLIKVTLISAQIDYNQFTGKSVNLSTTVRVQEPYYFKYDTTERIIAKAEFFSKRSTPEALLSSIFSSPDINAYNSNYANGKVPVIQEAVLKRRTKSDTLSNYFLLVHKLEYNEGNGSHAIVKYWEIINGKKDKLYSIHAIKENGSWLGKELNSKEDMDYVIRILKPEAFRALKTSSKPEVDYLKELHEKTRSEIGVLNISKLATILKEWDEKNLIDYLSPISDL